MCRSDVPRFAPCNRAFHQMVQSRLVVTLPQVLGFANLCLALRLAGLQNSARRESSPGAPIFHDGFTSRLENDLRA